MINYVNNAYDKVLKPCDAQRFSIITNSQETERLILAHRGGDEKAKSKLPAITYMGSLIWRSTASIATSARSRAPRYRARAKPSSCARRDS